MKNRINKKRIYKLLKGRPYGEQTARKRVSLAEMIKGTTLGVMKAIKAEMEVWDRVVPVGREFGSKDYERLSKVDALANAATVAQMRLFVESHPPIRGIDTKALIADGRD